MDGNEDAAARGSLSQSLPVAAAPSDALPRPGGRLSEEIEAARSYRARAKAENTIRAYESDWRQFEGWCDERRLDVLPARAEAVAAYLAALAAAGRADSTIPGTARRSPGGTASTAWGRQPRGTRTWSSLTRCLVSAASNARGRRVRRRR